jgi:phage tail-like protein
MPNPHGHDPYRNFRFRVEIAGLVSAGFTEVEIGASVVEVIEYREGIDQAVRKLPGLHKTGDVTLKRGVTSSQELVQWFRSVVNGDPGFRKDVAIAVLGEDGTTEVARFVVLEAWPRKLVIGELHAKGNEVLIECIELANEGIERAQ